MKKANLEPQKQTTTQQAARRKLNVKIVRRNYK